MNGNVKRSTQTPKPVRTPAAATWPPSFANHGQAAEVVDDPDRDGDRRTEQQPARLLTEVQEGERRHEHAEEEGEPAEARHR